MDFTDSLDYLFGLQRFGIKLGLENIRQLLSRLQNPHRRFRIVHVAGTNGKGSVSSGLASVLRQAGFRVGLYTSPHLQSFTERIRVNGEPIAERDVARLTQEIRACAQGIPATFFEFTTAMALLYFAQEKIDVAILEVGMGGRLDATNVVEPTLCLLTPVSLDHSEHLGASLEEIAAEKAGIIKPRTPVVSASQPPEALAVIRQKATELQAPLRVCGEDFSYSIHGATFDYADSEGRLDALETNLLGVHQKANMALVVAACRELALQGTPVDQAALRWGLNRVEWPGRLEWWNQQRFILLDGAHNLAGAETLAAYLLSLGNVRVHWVVGLKGDKDFEAVMTTLLPLAKAVYTCEPPSETAVDADLLVRLARNAQCSARVFSSVDCALRSALESRRDDEIVLVAGSLFLVAACRQWLLETKDCPS